MGVASLGRPLEHIIDGVEALPPMLLCGRSCCKLLTRIRHDS
jgi:hypothetical protein